MTLRKAVAALVDLPTHLSALALFALMLLTFADVMLRSVFNAPIEVAADLTRLLMAATVFSVMPALCWQGKQIAVDLLDGVAERAGLVRWRNAAVDLLCGAALIWPVQRIGVLAERARSYGDEMEYLGLPLHITGWFICALTALTAATLLLRGGLWLFAPATFHQTEGDSHD